MKIVIEIENGKIKLDMQGYTGTMCDSDYDKLMEALKNCGMDISNLALEDKPERFLVGDRIKEGKKQ